MVAEKDSSVEEVPATYRKKTQMWLIIAFVLIALALFANMMYQILSKHPKEKDVQPQVTEQKTQHKDKDSDPDRFANLIDNRQARIHQQLENPQLQQPVSSYRQQAQPTNKGLFTHKSDPVKEAKAKFKEQQIIAALRARGTRYDSSLASSKSSGYSSGQSFGSTSTDGSSTTNREKVAQINQLKSSIQDKIQQLRADAQQRRGSTKNVDQKISNAKSRLANVQSGGGVTSSPSGVKTTVTRLAQGSSSTTNAEPQIVGYSKDNKYGADTSGKIKLPVGTVINAITTFTAISDYMGGSMKAMITTDVYDADKTHVLIPKGSQLMIKAISASSVNEVIQNRLAFTVTWVILPNGNRIDFSKASALDRMGTPAVKADEVNYHFMAQLLGVTAYALVGSSTSYSGSGDSDDSFEGEFGDQARSQASDIAAKYLQVVPTKTIYAGKPIRIITEDEMFISPWSTLYEDYAY